jgi:hypothetical protein
MIVLGAMLFVSVVYDVARIEAGRSPAIVGLGGVLFVYALVSYLTAATARARIRRDLRKISPAAEVLG